MAVSRAQSTTLDTQVASTLAGVTARVILHPVDCVKTRLQHLRGTPGRIDEVAHIARFVAKEGVAGLYRGIFSALAGVVPYSMCKLYWNLTALGLHT